MQDRLENITRYAGLGVIVILGCILTPIIGPFYLIGRIVEHFIGE